MSVDPTLVSSYWRHYGRVRGDRRERLAAAEDFWAWQAVQATVQTGREPLQLLDALLAAPDADPCYVGAGPVEDLLAADPQRWDEPLALRCRRDPLWRQAVACATVDERHRRLLRALLPYLSRPG